MSSPTVLDGWWAMVCEEAKSGLHAEENSRNVSLFKRIVLLKFRKRCRIACES